MLLLNQEKLKKPAHSFHPFPLFKDLLSSSTNEVFVLAKRQPAYHLISQIYHSRYRWKEVLEDYFGTTLNTHHMDRNNVYFLMVRNTTMQEMLLPV